MEEAYSELQARWDTVAGMQVDCRSYRDVLGSAYHHSSPLRHSSAHLADAGILALTRESAGAGRSVSAR